MSFIPLLVSQQHLSNTFASSFVTRKSIVHTPTYHVFRLPHIVPLRRMTIADSLSLIVMVQSFGFVYWQWGFGPIELGLAFVPIGIGYLIAYGAFTLFIRHNVAMRVKQPGNESVQYESRLVLLLFLGPLLPLGLLLFAFTAAWFQTPIHWIGSMFASCMIGVANFAIYMATVDYVLRAYGPYAASATGGNGWARDFLAGMLTPYAIPMVSTTNPYLMSS